MSLTLKSPYRFVRGFPTIGAAVALIASVALCGCGGSAEYFDEFQPRPAVTADFESRTHTFSWLPNGNPLDADLGAMTLNFSDFPANTGTFTITEKDGGSASGTATWSAPTITLTVTSTTGSIGVNVDQVLTATLEAEANDRRIRLTHPTNGSNAASDL